MYPSVIFGKSFVLPLPSTIISPSVAFTLPHIPMFCIKSEPVGFVDVSVPLPFTYTLAPATNPLVSIFFILPLIIALPTAWSARVSFRIPIAGILAEFEESANSIFTFSPVTPVACTANPFEIGEPLVFFTFTKRSCASNDELTLSTSNTTVEPSPCVNVSVAFETEPVVKKLPVSIVVATPDKLLPSP